MNEQIPIWLMSLNLSEEYLNLSMENVHDSIEFIKEIGEKKDLREIGIVYEKDINKLLRDVKGLNEDNNVHNENVHEGGKEFQYGADDRIEDDDNDILNDTLDEEIVE